jgi:hypothetical protein
MIRELFNEKLEPLNIKGWHFLEIGYNYDRFHNTRFCDPIGEIFRLQASRGGFEGLFELVNKLYRLSEFGNWHTAQMVLENERLTAKIKYLEEQIKELSEK